KPKELADDMESFVYVVTYCAFRWHKHSLSSDNVDALRKANPDEQARANRDNPDLALAKQLFFYQETHKNGIFSGGANKLTHITSGSPPIQLDDQGSPLHNLLKQLYKLLQAHYAAVDMAALTPYLPVPPAPKPSTPQRTPSSGSSSSEVYMEAYALAGIQSPISRLPTASTKSSASRSSSSSRNASGTDTSSGVPASCRTLDDHTAIRNIFLAVLKDADGRSLGVKKYLRDKLYDQFNDNVVIVQTHIKNPSSGSDLTGSTGTSGEAAPATSTAGKRKSSELSKPEPDPRPAQKVKKTVNHGMLCPS
ncbi:hypothetical protein PHLGIDRAFT_118149, partial [Phlebiopsis gigantea 11061_1 CR5-6]